MKARYILTLGALILFSSLAMAGDDPSRQTQSDQERQIARLQTKVHQLESQVERLQKRLDQLEAEEAPPPTRRLPRLLPPVIPNDRGLRIVPAPEPSRPKIWGERQINGWTFYIVPCGGSAGTSK